MKRYLVRRVEIDGDTIGMALMTGSDDGRVTIERWQGSECHSTRMADATVLIDTETPSFSIHPPQGDEFVKMVKHFCQLTRFNHIRTRS